MRRNMRPPPREEGRIKSAQGDANTARALAVVRFGHRPPAVSHKPTDRTDYNTLRRMQLSSAQCNDRKTLSGKA